MRPAGPDHAPRWGETSLPSIQRSPRAGPPGALKIEKPLADLHSGCEAVRTDLECRSHANVRRIKPSK